MIVYAFHVAQEGYLSGDVENHTQVLHLQAGIGDVISEPKVAVREVFLSICRLVSLGD
jgi:hypothetical protein